MLITTLTLALLAAPAAPPAKAPAPAKGAAKSGAPASADDTAKARELFQWAQKLYSQARYAEAIVKFEEAYALKPHPVIFFNIGKCYEQLNETAKALRAYRDYLRLNPEAKDRETVTDAIANLERRLKERGLQQLMVFAEPPNARIDVDGKELGTSPASVELIAGNHKLTVKADGFETVERSFVMSTAHATEMTIALRPGSGKEASLPPPPPPPPPEPGTKVVVVHDGSSGGKPADAPTETKLTPDGSKPPPMEVKQPGVQKKGKIFTWVAGGAAVVAAGVGTGMAISSGNAVTQLHTLDPNRTREQANGLVTAANTGSTGAVVGFSVAGAALATGVVLFFLEGR
jgi:hypothetical protein